MTKRTKFTIEFEIDLDSVPGAFHQAEDWINRVTQQFEAQKHYHPTVKLVNGPSENNAPWYGLANPLREPIWTPISNDEARDRLEEVPENVTVAGMIKDGKVTQTDKRKAFFRELTDCIEKADTNSRQALAKAYKLYMNSRLGLSPTPLVNWIFEAIEDGVTDEIMDIEMEEEREKNTIETASGTVFFEPELGRTHMYVMKDGQEILVSLTDEDIRKLINICERK